MRRAAIVCLVTLLTMMAMPLHAAHAVPPIRERFPNRGISFVIPAGPCPFAIRVQVRFVFESTTQFGDGRTVFTDHSDFTLTNVETGSAYVEHTNATFTDTFTTDGNILEVLDGRYFFLFLPGDLGPGGVVGDGGALFILVGHVEYAYDPDTNLNITFQADGRATDVCQLLSP